LGGDAAAAPTSSLAALAGRAAGVRCRGGGVRPPGDVCGFVSRGGGVVVAAAVVFVAAAAGACCGDLLRFGGSVATAPGFFAMLVPRGRDAGVLRRISADGADADMVTTPSKVCATGNNFHPSELD
jgi:hypothetical protein